MRAEVGRKALHLLALVVPAAIIDVTPRVSADGRVILEVSAEVSDILVPLSAVAVAGDVLRVRSAGFRKFVHVVFGGLMRPEEVPPLGGAVCINGATWVLLSATLLLLVFPVYLVVPAFTMFMISDAAAALVGRTVGRMRWPGSRRTVEGSIAFVATGLLVMLAFPDIQYGVAAAAVVVGALAEVAPRPLNDNMRVPFVAAAVMWLLERLAA